MVKCPHCLRFFNEIVALRHIPICANTMKRARPPPSKQEVMERHLNRKNTYMTKPRQVSVEVGSKIDSGRAKSKTNIQL